MSEHGTVFKRPLAFSPRELDILRLIWAGCTNRQIAGRLGIKHKTVEANRQNMMRKAQVSRAAQLLQVALREGFLSV